MFLNQMFCTQIKSSPVVQSWFKSNLDLDLPITAKSPKRWLKMWICQFLHTATQNKASCEVSLWPTLPKKIMQNGSRSPFSWATSTFQWLFKFFYFAIKSRLALWRPFGWDGNHPPFRGCIETFLPENCTVFKRVTAEDWFFSVTVSIFVPVSQFSIHLMIIGRLFSPTNQWQFCTFGMLYVFLPLTDD